MAATGQTFAAEPVVAAAADLKFALDEVAQSFKKDTGQSVMLTFGSSGTFATQIRNGAPFQMYLSADEDYVFKLHADGLTRDQGTLYAIGRIVLMAPPSSSLPVDSELKGLAAQIKTGQIKRFAIANPEHAPYGRRAVEALKRAGVWEAIRPKLVFGENVSQAAQFTTSGSAQGGIIALSLAKSPQLAQLGRYAVIPAEWHEPLRQRMVLLKNADTTAQAFYRYVQQPSARAVMRRYGFVLPGESN
jgi:molybdate transport system substrate-binding protein